MKALAVLIVIAVVVAVVTVATAQGVDTRQPRASSVGNGRGGPPAIAPAIRQGAKTAKCTVAAFKSEGFQHGAAPYRFAQTPPVSGRHHARWADWGLYSRPVPPQYLVQNLEHGGIVIHTGRSISAAAKEQIRQLFSIEPGYLVVVPRQSKKLVPPAADATAFPDGGFVVASWQRRLVCKTSGTKPLRILGQYVRRYRGTGPESVPAANSTAAKPADLPTPSTPAG